MASHAQVRATKVLPDRRQSISVVACTKPTAADHLLHMDTLRDFTLAGTPLRGLILRGPFALCAYVGVRRITCSSVCRNFASPATGDWPATLREMAEHGPLTTIGLDGTTLTPETRCSSSQGCSSRYPTMRASSSPDRPNVASAGLSTKSSTTSLTLRLKLSKRSKRRTSCANTVADAVKAAGRRSLTVDEGNTDGGARECACCRSLSRQLARQETVQHVPQAALAVASRSATSRLPMPRSAAIAATACWRGLALPDSHA